MMLNKCFSALGKTFETVAASTSISEWRRVAVIPKV